MPIKSYSIVLISIKKNIYFPDLLKPFNKSFTVDLKMKIYIRKKYPNPNDREFCLISSI